jgi:hypothetical protein
MCERLHFVVAAFLLKVGHQKWIQALRLLAKVARWYIFKPKIPVWVNFWTVFAMEAVGIFYGYIFGLFCGHLVYSVAIWYMLWLFGLFYGHLVYSVAIWYMLWLFGLFYGHLVYFMVIWFILWSFGLFYGHLVHFIPFWNVAPRKIWQPCSSPSVVEIVLEPVDFCVLSKEI